MDTRMNNSIGAVFLLVVALLAAGTAQQADARAKTDRVQLANGDLISGEIKGMENGKLSYGTDSMGTVHIEWDDVRGLDSNFFFRVRTIDGRRFFGALDFAETPGIVTIVHAEGVEEYDAMAIVAIRPIESGGWERLDVALGASYSDIKASDSRTTRFDGQVTYEDELSENVFTARSVVSETDNETNQSTRAEIARSALWQDPRYFNYYRGFWESIDELAIDSRTGASFGIGRRFLDSNRSKLAIIGGVQALTEEDSLGETTESLEGLLASRFRFWRFSAPEVELVTNLAVYPGITESGRVRGDADITLSWEIVDDLDLSLSAFGSFDNETNRDGSEFDYGITTGVIWEL